jgi:hypothetical protein
VYLSNINIRHQLFVWIRVLIVACRHVATCSRSAFSASDSTFQTMLSTVTAFWIAVCLTSAIYRFQKFIWSGWQTRSDWHAHVVFNRPSPIFCFHIVNLIDPLFHLMKHSQNMKVCSDQNFHLIFLVGIFGEFWNFPFSFIYVCMYVYGV